MLRNSPTNMQEFRVNWEVQIGKFAQLAQKYAARVREIVRKKDRFAKPG
jgi:hypothetical protein